MAILKEIEGGSPLYLTLSDKDKRSLRKFRALLIRQGISDTEFWMPIIHDYLAKHARLLDRTEMVGPKELLTAAKNEFGLDLSREDIYGFRNRAWKKNKDYFEVKNGKKATFSYDLRRLRPYFEKLAARRQRAADAREMADVVPVTKKLGNNQANPYKVMGFEDQTEETGDNR